MAFIRSFFQRKLNDSETENPASFKIFMNFSKSTETKIELDRKFFDLKAIDILKTLKIDDKCLIVETFSKSNAKVIGRRKIADFERPFSSTEFLPKNNKQDDLKYKFCLVDPDEVKTFSTSQIINNRFKTQTNIRSEQTENDAKVEKEAQLLLKFDLSQTDEKRVHLFLTNQMIYFKYSHDKQRITHIPLLLIDEITRNEDSKLIFTISSAGAYYFFICISSEMVRNWINAIQEFRQQAQIKKAVQTSEQEMKNSASKKMNHMLNFRNLTKETILTQREFRDLLFKLLQKNARVPEKIKPHLNYFFEFLNAFEKNDESDMIKIEGLLEAKGFKFDTKDSPVIFENNVFEGRATDGSDFSLKDFDREPKSQFARPHDKLIEILSELFEVADYLVFLFDECYNRSFKHEKV